MQPPDNARQNFIVDARHHVLEAFATLESAVILASQRFGATSLTNCSTLGQRLEALAKVKAGPKLAKAALPKIVECTTQAKELLAVRNDIVHSHQHIVSLGEPTAVYRNTAQSMQSFPTARLLTLGQHEKLRKNVVALAQKINPPSPPRPSPGAAAGP